MTLEQIHRKIRDGNRISSKEGLFLLRNAELLDLGDLANEIRFRNNPDPHVTYIMDTNPNYSNVCDIDCIFCAFYRHPGEAGAYRLQACRAANARAFEENAPAPLIRHEIRRLHGSRA